jgi:hypothetical protein
MKDMKEKLAIAALAFALVLFTHSSQALGITISQSSIETAFTAGDVYTKNLSLLWNGEAEIVGHIYHNITNASGILDGAGFNITYSENPVILKSGITKEVNMTIRTPTSLAPGRYYIHTFVKAEIPEIVEIQTQTNYYYIDGKYKKIADELNRTLNDTKKELNEVWDAYVEITKNANTLNTSVRKMNDTNFDLNKRVKQLEDENLALEDRISEGVFANRLAYLALLFVVIVAFISSIFISRRVRKKKESSEHKIVVPEEVSK